VYAGVLGVYGGVDSTRYVVNGYLEERLAALAVVATSLVRLGSSRRRPLVRLLRLHDHLLQTITLLVGAAVLHLGHRLLHVSKPSVRHFCLTARNKTILSRSRTEVPLTSIGMYIIHNLEPRKGLVGGDNRNMCVCE